MRHFLIALVRGYRIFIGPVLRFLNGGHGMCRHQPTCSQYAIKALKIHGAIRGSWLTLKRLMRCHPWGTYGYDPVPSKPEPEASTAGKQLSE